MRRHLLSGDSGGTWNGSCGAAGVRRRTDRWSVTPGARRPGGRRSPDRRSSECRAGPRPQASVGTGIAERAVAATLERATRHRAGDVVLELDVVGGIESLHALQDRRAEMEQLLEVALALRRDDAEAEQLNRQQQADPEDEERVRSLIPRVLDRAGEPVVSERRLVPVLVGDVPDHPTACVERCREQQQTRKDEEQERT